MNAIRKYLEQLIPVTDDEWQAIAGRLQHRQFGKGELLVKEGVVNSEIYFITRGLVRLYVISNGKEVSRQFFFENNFFSEYQSFLTRQPSTTIADALEKTEVYFFNYGDMSFFYNTIPSFQIVGRVIAEDLFIKISERVNSFLTESPETRYQQLVAGRPKVTQRIPQYMIASYLGITPEHLSRIRKKMAAK